MQKEFNHFCIESGGIMQWYYISGQSKTGPVTDADIEQQVREGKITPDTMVWNELTAKWQPYGKIKGGASADASIPEPAPEYSDQAAAAAPSQEARARYQFEFIGSGSEYFRIWIVNLLLSIVTLGIYSAWAKVRRNQYFYRNTRVAGSSFDYHGNPTAILKGRLIVAALFISINISQQYNPYLYYAVLIIFLSVFPWLITRSLSFRLHNSSWRSIRFRFHGTVKQAARVYYLYGLLSGVTLGICYPLLYRQIRVFLYDNSALGKTHSRIDLGSGPVYGVFIRTIGLCIGIPLLAAVFGRLFGSLLGPARVLLPVAIVLSYLAILLCAYPFFQARMGNLIWNSVSMGGARFESSLTVRSLASIWVSNAFLTFITLGLYWPWAAIRMARYRAESLAISTQSGLDNFTADAAADVSAVGEEIADAYDFDISF